MATQDLSAYGLASRTGGKRTLVYFQDFITAESVQTNGTGEYISSLSGTWALLSQVATAGGVLQVNLDTTAVYSAGVCPGRRMRCASRSCCASGGACEGSQPFGPACDAGGVLACGG
jgi:hypothetical protein